MDAKLKRRHTACQGSKPFLVKENILKSALTESLSTAAQDLKTVDIEDSKSL